MAKLSSIAPQTTHRVCLFGPPKSGKTELAGKLAEHFNLLWFDLENGYQTLTKLPTAWQERIDIVRIPDTKVFPIAIETMLKVINGTKLRICDTHGKVNCPTCAKDNKPFTEVCLSEVKPDTIVVFDSGTQLANSAMNFLTKNQADDYKPEWQDYRNQGSLMDKFLSQLQQAPYNSIFITHEAEVEMEDGRKKLVPVSGTTNFSRNTAKYFDHVVYVELKNKKHVAGSSTGYSLNILTGSRTDVELEKLEAPTLLKIFKPELFGAQAKVQAPTPGQVALNNLKGMQK